VTRYSAFIVQGRVRVKRIKQRLTRQAWG